MFAWPTQYVRTWARTWGRSCAEPTSNLSSVRESIKALNPSFELASLIAEASVYFVIWIVGQTGVVEVRFNAIGNRRDGAPVQV